MFCNKPNLHASCAKKTTANKQNKQNKRNKKTNKQNTAKREENKTTTKNTLIINKLLCKEPTYPLQGPFDAFFPSWDVLVTFSYLKGTTSTTSLKQ